MNFFCLPAFFKGNDFINWTVQRSLVQCWCIWRRIKSHEENPTIICYSNTYGWWDHPHAIFLRELVQFWDNSVADVTDLAQFSSHPLAAQFKNGRRFLSILAVHMIILRNQFANLSLVMLSDLFRRVLSWEKLHLSSPHLSHQFENDAFILLPTWGQSGKIVRSNKYGSICSFSNLDLMISNADLLPCSPSVDKTKTIRLQMSPLSRQWSEHLKMGCSTCALSYTLHRHVCCQSKRYRRFRI